MGLGLLALGTFTYAFDPLQQYRKATLYRPYFDDQRYLVPGIARTFKYDTVIVGTSVADNFIKSHVDSILKVKTAKLTMGGASAHEQHIVLGTALRTGKLKQALISLDMGSYIGPPNRLRYGPGSLPMYLYDDTRLNDFKYFWNLDLLYKWTSRILLSNALGIRADKLDEDKAFYWGERDPYGREHLRENLKEIKALLNPDDYSLEELKKSFELNMVSHVKENPDVRFHFFFPPYSLPYWSALLKGNVIETAMEFKVHITHTLEDYPNVTLYDFQSDMALITDYDHYSNLVHYWPPVNRIIINDIAAKLRVVDKENIEQDASNLMNAARKFSENDLN